MTRDSQSRIDVLREAMEREKSQVEQLQYALVESEERDAERRPQRDPDHPERDVSTAARQALERGRARWRRIWRTQVRDAVQHSTAQRSTVAVVPHESSCSHRYEGTTATGRILACTRMTCA